MATDHMGNPARRPAGVVMAPCKGLGWDGLVKIFEGKGLTYNELALGTVLGPWGDNFIYPHNNSSRQWYPQLTDEETVAQRG